MILSVEQLLLTAQKPRYDNVIVQGLMGHSVFLCEQGGKVFKAYYQVSTYSLIFMSMCPCTKDTLSILSEKQILN